MPDLSRLDRPTTLLVALVAAILLVALATSATSAVRRRRKEKASLSAIDFVRSSFASQLSRGVPMDELLLQMVEALRDGFHRRNRAQVLDQPREHGRCIA